MATLAQWIEGARPRTLPAAVAPVMVGTASAYALGAADATFALLALLVAVGFQVGVNYANDYSDGVRGTDEDRVGPVRLVGQRLADPANVKAAAFACFFGASVLGLALVALSSSWVLLVLGAAAIWAAWNYTGGSNPYGYRGLGEVMVFIFFGLFAVLGTTWTQAQRLDWATLGGAVGCGALACAILVTNNLRDLEGDRAVDKRTVAVRLGFRRTRSLYTWLIVIAFLMLGVAALSHPTALLGLLAAPLAVRPVRVVRGETYGRDLLPALAQTGVLQLGYAVALSLGLVLAPLLLG
ncbi:1,4-dihydroxy-2-naphthoate polyprenyltransferase [Ornithinimicrobium tianjinense]|uniref:1,4-dihydroxy-2-naphthoate octaprenyltransferase n=1 Tax=Ornithinimicrobium tianjinense TaxID=1195761 RepID=A0A917EZW0_9MICO|nr:1,4-dihydroxy-2-naphthoate polyprenyltransferase [Ornithinimicrobium tianjinense]GGF38062.1 1,4-dihydroxy-2-naphthoate octaprenyltransferase [Ornithinimicrobium tianjinense]